MTGYWNIPGMKSNTFLCKLKTKYRIKTYIAFGISRERKVSSHYAEEVYSLSVVSSRKESECSRSVRFLIEIRKKHKTDMTPKVLSSDC